jgi:hypothetical protein
MTVADLIQKLVQLDPSVEATISVKDAAGVTTTMPVQWIAKNSIYSKMPSFTKSAEVVEKIFGPEPVREPYAKTAAPVENKKPF